MKWMLAPGRLIVRGVLAAASVWGLLGWTGDARANNTDNTRERAALERRVAIVREAMQLSDRLDDSTDGRPSEDKVAQWGNWPNWLNWGNWNNWPNWNNWANWFNFR